MEYPALIWSKEPVSFKSLPIGNVFLSIIRLRLVCLLFQLLCLLLYIRVLHNICVCVLCCVDFVLLVTIFPYNDGSTYNRSWPWKWVYTKLE